MNPSLDIFKNMHLFVEVAKSQSFRRAGESLSIPTSTISRRIAELERDLGLRLFNRSTRRVELTEGGRRYFENCKRIIQEAELAHQELSYFQAQPSGIIRASVPVDFSVLYLSPILSEFSRQYPGIKFDLSLTPQQVDLLTDSVDFAIRMGPPKDQSLIARPIVKLESLLVASPQYLRARGTPERPEDLLKHDCLRMKDSAWTLHHRHGGSQTVEVGGVFVANNRGMLHQLALAGHGVVQASRAIVANDLKANRLVEVMPEWAPPPVQVFALTTTRLLPAKVRVFLDFMIEALGHRAIL